MIYKVDKFFSKKIQLRSNYKSAIEYTTQHSGQKAAR